MESMRFCHLSTVHENSRKSNDSWIVIWMIGMRQKDKDFVNDVFLCKFRGIIAVDFTAHNEFSFCDSIHGKQENLRASFETKIKCVIGDFYFGVENF